MHAILNIVYQTGLQPWYICTDYHKGKNDNKIIIAIYVEDILLFSKYRTETNLLRKQFSSEFVIRDLEIAKSIIIPYIRDKNYKKNKTYLDQKSYIEKLLHRLKMNDYVIVTTYFILHTTYFRFQ